MMASSDLLPEYVRCIVEDSEYSSVVMQFNDNRKLSFRFIPPDGLQSASLVTKRKHGWSFWEASSAKQLEKCTIPVFFIHGDADDFVPFSHLQKNFDAKTVGYKEMFKYFDGEIPVEEAIRQIQSHTREYARKQLTWYKKDPTVTWFNLSDKTITTRNIIENVNNHI
jgi:pimeloyl-ACP methyl ester carboxylesterase